MCIRDSSYSLGQLTSHPLNWPSFGKGENKSQVIDIVSHCNPSRIINIKIEQTKQLYHNYYFPFAETRSVDVTSVDRENLHCMVLHINDACDYNRCMAFQQSISVCSTVTCFCWNCVCRGTALVEQYASVETSNPASDAVSVGACYIAPQVPARSCNKIARYLPKNWRQSSAFVSSWLIGRLADSGEQCWLWWTDVRFVNYHPQLINTVQWHRDWVDDPLYIARGAAK